MIKTVVPQEVDFSIDETSC